MTAHEVLRDCWCKSWSEQEGAGVGEEVDVWNFVSTIIAYVFKSSRLNSSQYPVRINTPWRSEYVISVLHWVEAPYRNYTILSNQGG